MQISKELLKKIEEEIYDKLPEHTQDTVVDDYELNIHSICITNKETLFIEVEKSEQ